MWGWQRNTLKPQRKRFTNESDPIEVTNLSVERKVTVFTIALHSHLPVTITVSSWTRSCRPTKQFPRSRGHSRRRRWSITYMGFDKADTRKHIPTSPVTAFLPSAITWPKILSVQHYLGLTDSVVNNGQKDTITTSGLTDSVVYNGQTDTFTTSGLTDSVVNYGQTDTITTSGLTDSVVNNGQTDTIENCEEVTHKWFEPWASYAAMM